MPYAKDTYSGDGATTDFNITFPYLDESHVLATVGGVSTAFTFLTATTARFATAPATGTNNVVIRRETKQDAPLVDFQNGSTPVESDLDTSGLQTLYLEQERDDIEGEFIRLDSTDDKMNAQSKVIKSVADGTANDEAVNFSQLNAVVVGGNGVPNPANPADDDKVLVASGGSWSWTLNPKTIIASITDITFSNIRTFLAATTTSGARAAIEAAGTAVSNVFTADQTLKDSSAGSGLGPTLFLDRDSASPAALDLLGNIEWRGRDDLGNWETLARIFLEYNDPSNTLEDATLYFQTNASGAISRKLGIRNGIFTFGATGGDKGVDTINAKAFYGNGVILQVHGQCRLTKSGANLLLSPYNGNHLVIDGNLEVVPSAGVTLAATSLSVDTTYFIYAYMNAGTMTLEASATGHTADTSNGVEIKSGDSTRTLVGMARTITGPAWQDATNQRFVISYFNRKPIVCEAGFSVNHQIFSTPGELDAEIRNEFLTWGDEAIDVKAGLTVVHSIAGNTAEMWIGKNGGTLVGYKVTWAVVDINVRRSFNPYYRAVETEGYAYYTIIGDSGATGTLTCIGNGTGSGSLLSSLIQG